MLYSLMNSNADYYVNLHGEQVITHAEKSVRKGTDCIWWEEPAAAGIMQRIADTDIRNERLFIDFEGIFQRQNDEVKDIQETLELLHSRQNTVYLMNIVEETGIHLEKGLEKKGIAVQREQAAGGEWFCEVSSLNHTGNTHQVALCEKAIHDIHMDNLLILMEESPRGKTFEIDRLLKDGETCLYYFFYRLAMRLVEEGMAKPSGENKGKLCFVPDNLPAIPIAKALAVFLDAEVECNGVEKHRFCPDMEYIIVRDVFHMTCELDRLNTAISLSGGQVKGVACLVDIYTGVGDRKNRVSLHTIDLEKGISYRIRQKRENLGQKGDF